ncbi:hypothetical protein [Tabrizicola sp.]|uniref:hypothetical protein n=1 Tax=Tabrizicola sp. TaxID=2005166 RepID=UPI0027346FE3|nr:hypothetical protein [Tabrizicola sp.]MDP3194755.1 hypothetical protein [Tabrizicola sp.]
MPEPGLGRAAYGPGRLARLGRFLLNGIIGTLLCTGPVTALIALGWLTRRQGYLARDRFGAAEDPPGWLRGPREWNGRPTGRLVRALGGLAANTRAGLMALTALLAWTLPFTLLWLGAWWAGWENSFNKGYEQALVGPSVFLLGVLLAALILPALPLMLAHLATEDRLAAAFELRRVRSLTAQATWRIPALMLVTTLCALPFAAARGLVTTSTDWAPWVQDLAPDQLAALQGQITLGFAALAFVTSWLLRSLAARSYALAAPRAAGLKPGLWDGTQPAEAARPARRRSRWMTALWYGVASGISLALSFLILSGQFLDHAWWRWLFHPALTLPWAG